jgi:hypothetical protein
MLATISDYALTSCLCIPSRPVAIGLPPLVSELVGCTGADAKLLHELSEGKAAEKTVARF